MNPNITLKANIVFRGKIECLTGLHIGASNEKLEIGGVDSPVIRHPHTKYPYIPGSSLKGKLRSLLEFSLGVVDKNGDVSKDPQITRLFGIGANEKENNKIVLGPTRLIVRDCNPDEETIKMWENEVDSLLLYTEYKAENTLNRITSAANPRFIERVVAGSKFDFELIYTVFHSEDSSLTHFKNDTIQTDIKNLFSALRLLENNYIGKSGSRGYGKIKFHCEDPLIITAEDYKNGTGNYLLFNRPINPVKSLSEIQLEYKG